MLVCEGLKACPLWSRPSGPPASRVGVVQIGSHPVGEKEHRGRRRYCRSPARLGLSVAARWHTGGLSDLLHWWLLGMEELMGGGQVGGDGHRLPLVAVPPDDQPGLAGLHVRGPGRSRAYRQGP